MENFVILAKLPTGWSPSSGGDGGGRATTGTGPASRSPIKLVEEVVDQQGGRIDTITMVPLGGKVRVLCIGELPNHEAALKVVFGLGQFGFETEYGVAIDSQSATHAWELVQQQTVASPRGR